MFSALIQTEIPQPEKTEPGQEYGFYSFQDFIIANWVYISIVLAMAIIVLLYARYKKTERRKRYEESISEKNKN